VFRLFWIFGIGLALGLAGAILRNSYTDAPAHKQLVILGDLSYILGTIAFFAAVWFEAEAMSWCSLGLPLELFGENKVEWLALGSYAQAIIDFACIQMAKACEVEVRLYQRIGDTERAIEYFHNSHPAISTGADMKHFRAEFRSKKTELKKLNRSRRKTSRKISTLKTRLFWLYDLFSRKGSLGELDLDSKIAEARQIVRRVSANTSTS